MQFDQLQYLLKKYNLTPNKLRGQNFLVSDKVLEEIIISSKIDKDDLILEVGPGLGSLTIELTPKAFQVVAFEVDKNFSKPLNHLESINKNLNIVWQDILSLSNKQWADILDKYNKKDYKVVANIPYYLTNKFIQKFLSFDILPKSMTLMIQKEVADRIVNVDNKNSLLSLSVDFYAQSEIVSHVNKNNFYPEPKVDSAILHIFEINKWSYDVDEKKTWQLIKRGFAKKRKKLINNLLSDPKLNKNDLSKIFAKLGLEENIRAEKLSKNQWLNLSKEINSK